MRPITGPDDTAYWVAWFRGQEEGRRRPLFIDRYARRLAGKRGEELARTIPSGPLRWSLAVKTVLFDELALLAIEGGVDGVINLGSGFDVRPYRLDLPSSLWWLEVDGHQILERKAEILRGETPRCEVERIAADVTNREEVARLFERVKLRSQRPLFITEGMLVYLQEEEVAVLARNISGFRSARWLFEVVSPAQLARQAASWGPMLNRAGMAMQFGPSNGADHFVECGFRVCESRSVIEEAVKRRRAPTMLALTLGLAPSSLRRELAEAVTVALSMGPERSPPMTADGQSEGLDGRHEGATTLRRSL